VFLIRFVDQFVDETLLIAHDFATQMDVEVLKRYSEQMRAMKVAQQGSAWI